MKIELIGNLTTVQSNPENTPHNYFGWPSVAKLPDGRIAVGSSGYRLAHVCPFGKAVVSYSSDNGETYTSPEAVIDTVLDDRDCGITPFGDSGIIVTSFNNTVEFQRGEANGDKYRLDYLDTITPEQEKEVLGPTFRISTDLGKTFSKLHISPITSPHGPIQLRDGTILWVGTTFSKTYEQARKDTVQAYRVNLDGTMDFLGRIDDIIIGADKLYSCEPHAIELEDGTILCHIRAQGRADEKNFFTTFQSVSTDGGKTWSKPEQILVNQGGAPAHLMIHSSGTIISSYGYRLSPYGIRMMFSEDNGKTWDTDNILYAQEFSSDLGYPATIELDDGTLLTVFYAHPDEKSPAVILQQKWKIVK